MVGTSNLGSWNGHWFMAGHLLLSCCSSPALRCITGRSTVDWDCAQHPPEPVGCCLVNRTLYCSGNCSNKHGSKANSLRGYMYTVYCILYTVYCILCTVYCVLYTVYCILSLSLSLPLSLSIHALYVYRDTNGNDQDNDDKTNWMTSSQAVADVGVWLYI